jgi:hypothetical protein
MDKGARIILVSVLYPFLTNSIPSVISSLPLHPSTTDASEHNMRARLRCAQGADMNEPRYELHHRTSL